MTLRWSLVALWAVCPFAFWLTSHRPFTESREAAQRLPASLGEYSLATDHGITPRMEQLLGTSDAIWRTYVAPDDARVYVVLVCHRENWKSVHPPDICLRGSNMILTDSLEHDDVGELVLFNEGSGRSYLSLYQYGADGLATGSYSEFFLHHAPRALFRAATDGYLLRIETDFDRGKRDAARARCRGMLEAMQPFLREIVRPR